MEDDTKVKFEKTLEVFRKELDTGWTPEEIAGFYYQLQDLVQMYDMGITIREIYDNNIYKEEEE